MLQHQRCVVLNNLYQEKIQQAAAACLENPAAISVFQPSTARHLCAVRDCMPLEDQPVPVFLVAGNYGEVASGVGLLRKVEYSDEMPEGRKEEISKHILDSEGLFALNVLTITNVSALRQPIPLSLFVKVSNEKPLSPGHWTASVCYLNDLLALIAAI